MGVVSPIGIGVDQFWSAAVNGMSGIKRITSFDASSRRSQIAGEVADFDPSTFLSQKYIEQTDRFTQLALLAARLALEDAKGLDIYAPHRLAVSIGSGMGGFSTFESSALRRFRNQPVPPFTVPRTMANSAAAWIAIKHGFKGMNLTSSTACSSGANAIGAALDLLRAGRADAVVAGGAEACVLPLTINGFEILHALTTTSNDNPAGASRPFAKGRDGFVMGEGAGILILEREEQARSRGAKIYAELAGYGCTSDAHHVVVPVEDGETTAMAMTMALEDAGVKPEDVDYINAHGTSTQMNDKYETIAMKRALGEYAYQVPISSTKSQIGHTLGASAAIESVVAVQSILTGWVPPTINQEYPDPDCDLDYVPNTSREVGDIKVVLKNSFGFGGQNACLVFKKYEG